MLKVIFIVFEKHTRALITCIFETMNLFKRTKTYLMKMLNLFLKIVKESGEETIGSTLYYVY